MNVVIASELGKGFGHATQVSLIARALRAAGHTPTSVIKDVTALRSLLGYEGNYEVLQAPLSRPSTPFDRVNSFADILVEAAFDRIDELSAKLGVWASIFRVTGASALVVDHAPVALFAAHALSIPVLSATSGFNIPPSHVPFPLMSPGRPVEEQRRLDREAQLLQSLKKSLDINGLPAPTSLQLPFSELTLGLSTYSELDHYGIRAGAEYLGVPLHAASAEPEWPENGNGPRIFVYALWHPAIQKALTSVLEAGYAVCAVLTDAPPDVMIEYPNFQRMQRLVDIRTALAQCDVFLNHGSCNSVMHALTLGTPVVMVPLWQEQELFARRVASLGAGLITRPEQILRSVEICLRDHVRIRQASRPLAAKATSTDVLTRHEAFFRRQLAAIAQPE